MANGLLGWVDRESNAQATVIGNKQTTAQAKPAQHFCAAGASLRACALPNPRPPRRPPERRVRPATLPTRADFSYVITVQINVKTEAACPDWFSPGSPNDLYTAALGSFFLDGTTPSFACRQVASTVHTLELIGPQDGSNFLFDDPRKVSQAVADMRTINVDNRVSLVLWYQYTVASPDVGQNIFATLDENVRNGNFLNAVVSNGADAAAPLLEAVTFQQLYSGGVGCFAPQ